MSKYNDKGEEILDQTPVAMPINFKRPLPLNERIRQMVINEMSQYSSQAGGETFEEADDFDIPDDPIDKTTPYEEDFDPEVPFIAAREAEIKHGAVSDFQEEKIQRGYEEAEKLRSVGRPKPAPHTPHKREGVLGAEADGNKSDEIG